MIDADPKEYKLYSKTSFVMFLFIVPGFLVLIGASWLYFGIAHSTSDGPPVLAGLVPAAAGAFSWLRMARMPQRIIRHADGRIELECQIRRVVLTPREIVSIRPDRGHFGFLVLKHDSGTLRLLNQFTGFHELLTSIEAANPAVELLGC
jgi:hypothetical protein